MGINISVIRSGSSGNCTALWTKNECVLIDCGHVRVSELEYELNQLGISCNNIRGIIVTHAHSDHIDTNGLKFALAYGIKVYIHPENYEIVYSNNQRVIKQLEANMQIAFHRLAPFKIGVYRIEPFRVKHPKHNPGYPLGFALSVKRVEGNVKFGYMTDLKEVTPEILEKLAGVSALIIETNYDQTVIDNGYGQHGWDAHLSNQRAARAVCDLSCASSPSQLRYVFLAHVSDRNNTHEDAWDCVTRVLHLRGVEGIELVRTHRYKRSRVITVQA
ncbi:MAG: MBL fold metallo-hydrolase [Elusimicrobiota bacterium]